MLPLPDPEVIASLQFRWLFRAVPAFLHCYKQKVGAPQNNHIGLPTFFKRGRSGGLQSDADLQFFQNERSWQRHWLFSNLKKGATTCALQGEWMEVQCCPPQCGAPGNLHPLISAFQVSQWDFPLHLQTISKVLWWMVQHSRCFTASGNLFKLLRWLGLTNNYFLGSQLQTSFVRCTHDRYSVYGLHVNLKKWWN